MLYSTFSEIYSFLGCALLSWTYGGEIIGYSATTEDGSTFTLSFAISVIGCCGGTAEGRGGSGLTLSVSPTAAARVFKPRPAPLRIYIPNLPPNVGFFYSSG
jgi:hypothetical protein